MRHGGGGVQGNIAQGNEVKRAQDVDAPDNCKLPARASKKRACNTDAIPDAERSLATHTCRRTTGRRPGRGGICANRPRPTAPLRQRRDTTAMTSSLDAVEAGPGRSSPEPGRAGGTRKAPRARSSFSMVSKEETAPSSWAP